MGKKRRDGPPAIAGAEVDADTAATRSAAPKRSRRSRQKNRAGSKNPGLPAAEAAKNRRAVRPLWPNSLSPSRRKSSSPNPSPAPGIRRLPKRAATGAGGATADAAAPAAASAAESADAAPAEEQLPAGTQVKSPLVGTFYSSPSPDEPPFVLVGQQVKEGDTLCIIEAMKIMNEIKAPCDGKVIRIMAQPGDMVEYNQVLCVIE